MKFFGLLYALLASGRGRASIYRTDAFLSWIVMRRWASGSFRYLLLDFVRYDALFKSGENPEVVT